MRRNTALTGAAFALAAAGAVAASGGGSGSGTRSGVTLWVEGHCGSCHTLAAASASATRGPDLDRLQPSVVAVAAQVANGGHGMPSFAGRFSAPEIETLAIYVSSVAGTRPAPPVKAKPKPAPAKTPSPAQTSATVRTIQLRLQRLGFFAGPVTGFYGPLTVDAVKRFQTTAGLSPDGVWSRATAAALAGRRPATLAQPLTPPAVGLLPLTTASTKQLQQELTTLGFFHGPETGYYGAETTAAVKLFQASVGLAPDGQWGPASDAALLRKLG